MPVKFPTLRWGRSGDATHSAAVQGGVTGGLTAQTLVEQRDMREDRPA
jgi:hypothetical protein